MINLLLLLAIALAAFSCGDNPATRPAPVTIGETQVGWELVSEYRMPPSEGRLSNKFAFTKELRLWSRGSSDTETNQMMYSDDFGKSWKFVDLPYRGFGGDAVIFYDSDHGWAMDTSMLLKTEDGGITWKKIHLPASSKIVRLSSLNSFEFKDVNHGFVAGSTTVMDRGLGTMSYGVEILRTQDSGESWSTCYKNNTNNEVRRMFSFQNSTMALVDQTTFLISKDAGIHWKEKHLDFPATDIEVTPKGILWTTGEDGFLRSSIDFGDTWQTVSPKPALQAQIKWNSISFDASGCGVAVGTKGTVASTIDGGRSWALQSDTKLQADLWTVRVQRPYVAIFDGTTIYVFRQKASEKDQSEVAGGNQQ